MNDQTDQQLLRDYAERQSEAAFAAIVQRYVDLVYSAAFRMVNDPHAAKDVTQSVFVALAQNARQLTGRPAVAGWLHGTARNLAAKTVRSEVRRRAREQEAALMNDLLATNTDASWEQIAPQLDEALGELSEPDRDAVLLRYFNNHDLRTVGATLGISDDAAQKRVSRAVERLREFLAKRGVTVGAGGLVVVISANAVQAAPVGLVVTILSAATVTGTTLATTTSAVATKTVVLTTLQKALVTATVAVLIGGTLYEARRSSQLRDRVQMLQQQQATLTGQLGKLQQERDDATSRLAAMRNDSGRSNRDTAELLRLRSQVTQLRSDLAQRPDPAGSSVKSADPNGTRVVYKYDDAPRKAAMRTKLANMNERLGLSDEQKQAIEGIVTNLFSKDPESQIKALLSPEQQAAYHELRQEETTANVRARVKAEVGELQ